MATARAVISDEALLQLPKDGNKYEVVDGELRMSPTGLRHERIVARLLSGLAIFLRDHRLGEVLGSSLLYRLPSGNRRGPDISFIAAGRVPDDPAIVFPAIAPDLAVEVLSPGNSPRRMLDKVGEYLQAGVRLVWVIDPDRRAAAVYRSLTDVRHVSEAESLDGEDVIPGFRSPLGELFK